MDDDPLYGADDPESRFGSSIAPPLYPMTLFRRALGSTDPVQANAANPDFDGAASAQQGLPIIEPLRGWSLMNGGSEIELYRYAHHGERVKVQSSYVDIVEKQGRTGPMILVTQENIYRTESDELLLRVVRTHIWKPV
jgi:hydroxyacyl-ACP dehydratase HTD2-like protein with hotdog domain